jgi:hypothetical protein
MNYGNGFNYQGQAHAQYGDHSSQYYPHQNDDALRPRGGDDEYDDDYSDADMGSYGDYDEGRESLGSEAGMSDVRSLVSFHSSVDGKSFVSRCFSCKPAQSS